MKKKLGWILVLAVLLLSGAAYYFITLSLYEPTEDLLGFPVPKRAELVGQSTVGKNYEWPRASETDGIPYGYELAIKKNGWKKGEREGASVYYTKGNYKIDLICTQGYLDILRVNQPEEKNISSQDANKETGNTPDYVNVRILEIDNGKMMIGPPATDPEASYPAYEVFIDKETKVEGEKTSIDELIEGDHVSVWIKAVASDKEFAEKIIVAK